MLSVPTVSVCIPTYRGEAYISEAIESVLAQDYTDFEVVVIDDNSPDQTAALVSSYQDARVRYVKNPSNLGPEGNWNRCLEEAKGRYFKLLPQDDVLAPNCLGRQVDVLDSDEGQTIALVFCARNIINQHGRVIAKRSYPGCAGGRIKGQNAIRSSIRFGTNLIGEPGGVMFRKSLTDKAGNFDGSIGYVIDLDYWFRLLVNGDAYCLTEPLVSFRVSNISWSVAIGNKQSLNFHRFIDKCATQKKFKINFLDIVLGKMLAKINNCLRLAFYKFSKL
ncbi:MAG: glycosyltransferase family 2 protein [Candidatus Methylumidiphilus sp.]